MHTASSDVRDFDLVCLGGGAAGFFGAISCAEMAPHPLKIAIVEGTPRSLTKVKVSGGGRCNVTHNAMDPRQLILGYPRGGKSLLSAFYRFGPKEMLNWLDQAGIATKAEADGRIFPAANTSQAIIDCFHQQVTRHGIELLSSAPIKSITYRDGWFFLDSPKKSVRCRRLVLATGSSPLGHKLARKLGHQITPLAPSLFTLKSTHPVCRDLAGVAVPNTVVKLRLNESLYKQQGPTLITHWGFSGPAVLKLSSFGARDFLQQNYSGVLEVNWMPHQNGEQTFTQLKELRNSQPRKGLATTKIGPLPRRLWHRLVELAEMKADCWAEASNKDLQNLQRQIHQGQYSFSGKGEFKEEFVTCGGVPLSEVDLTTFESLIQPGLYFAGEILDIDGITGGYNFQNAWTSSRLAAQAIVTHLST